MAKSKYEKYFFYKTPSSALHRDGTFPGTPMVWLNDKVMKGAFYFECIWMTGNNNKASKPHSHDFDEYIGFYGSDPHDPFNLNAEVEFWFDDEKHIITRSCTVYVPAGTWHTPITVSKMKKPIFCFSTAPTTKYMQNVNRDPRWAHLPDPMEAKE